MAFVAALGMLAPAYARSEALRAAVFPLELDDTSLQGSMDGPAAAEQARVAHLDAQLREGLAASGRYTPIPLGAAASRVTEREMRTCDGCEVDFAREIGAQVTVIGWVQKVSNLILNVNLVVRDVASGKVIRAGSVDIRGNTDESWSRGLRYLLVNRILADGGEAAR